jgi:hypothetical protein
MANSLTFENFQYYGSMIVARLKKKLHMASRVTTNFIGATAEAGAIINVPFVNFSGAARTRAKGAAVVVDDLSNGNYQVTMAELYSAVALDQLDVAFANVDLMARGAEETAGVLAAGIDSLVTSLWNKIPNEVGETDATAAFNATDKLLHLSAAIKRLEENLSPMTPLYGLVNPSEAHNLRQLDALLKVNEAGGSATRDNADLGRILGVDMMSSTQIEASILSATAAWGTPLIDLVAGYAIGSTTIHVDGVGSGLTILKGSTFTLGGYRYVVTTTAVATVQDIDLVIYPPLRAAAVDDDALTPLLHTNATNRSHNLIWHPSAFGLALRQLPNFVPGSGVYQQTVADPDTGLAVQLSIESHAIGGANVAGTQTLKVAVLGGAVVLQPAAAVRIEGIL